MRKLALKKNTLRLLTTGLSLVAGGSWQATGYGCASFEGACASDSCPSDCGTGTGCDVARPGR